MTEQAKYWNDRGKNYLAEFANMSSFNKRIMKKQEQAVIKLLKPKQFSTILEIGCGFGRYTNILHKLFQPLKFVAVDSSIDQTQTAQATNNKKIEFVCKPIQEFQADRQFDLVFASEVLMHISKHGFNDVIKKMISLAKQKIITVDWFDAEKITDDILSIYWYDEILDFIKTEYCFMHDYRKLSNLDRVKKLILHNIPLPIESYMVDIYAKIRHRTSIHKQVIVEIDLE